MEDKIKINKTHADKDQKLDKQFVTGQCVLATIPRMSENAENNLKSRVHTVTRQQSKDTRTNVILLGKEFIN